MSQPPKRRASEASVEEESLQAVGDKVGDCVQMWQCDQIQNMCGSTWLQENGEKLMGRCMVGTEWCTNHGKEAVELV